MAVGAEDPTVDSHDGADSDAQETLASAKTGVSVSDDAARSQFAPPPTGSAWEAHTPADQTRGPRVPGKLGLIVAVGAVAVVMAVMVVVLGFEAAFLRRLGDPSRLSGLDRDIDRITTLDTVLVIVTLVAGAIVVAWLYRAYRSLSTINVARRHRPFMAIVGWIIPIANLMLPARVLNDLAGAGLPGHARRMQRMVISWAVLLGIGWFLARYAPRRVETAVSIDEMRTGIILSIAASIALLVAGAIFVVMIVTIAGWRRSQQVDAGSGGGVGTPPPRTPFERARRQAVVSSIAVVAMGAAALAAGSIVAGGATGAGGAGSAGEPTLTHALRPGDCIADLAEHLGADVVVAVATVGCDEPHDAEVIDAQRLRGGPWPGDDEIERMSMTACLAAFERYVGASLYLTPFDITYLQPLEDHWPDDDGVTCIAMLPVPGVGSVAGFDPGDGWEGIHWSDALAPGQCIAPGGFIPGNVSVVDCAEPHDYEMIGTHDIGESEYPGEHVVDSTAEAICLELFRDYVGIDYEESVFGMEIAYPFEHTWEFGNRRIGCFVVADGDTGSVSDTQQ